MNDKKQIPLEELYKPSEKIRQEIFDVYDKYIRWRSLREQPYKQFNGMVLTDYIQQSREKFWGYIPLNYDSETPQFFFPETRNQVISILAKIANLKMKPIFEGVEGFDILKATVLNDLFESWKRGSNRKIENFWQFLYNVINGTEITFVAYRSDVKKVRMVKEYDPESGETEFEDKELDLSDVDEVIVNLEDFFVPKIWEPTIEKQNECIWRSLLKLNDFKNEFKGYKLVDMVQPGSQFADSSIFADFLAYDVRGGDFVEVIRYYNWAEDKYMIIANGVLMNPLKEKGKKDVISPLPWNHKKAPFAKTIFEPIDANFFYGKPLPQTIKSPQDALNKMWELMIDREQRSIAAPIITNDPGAETGLKFKAGRIYQVQGDVNQFKELGVQPTSSSYWNALTSLQGIINRTGSGGIGSVVPTRQPRSASEKAIEAQQMKESSGVHYLFYEDLLEQKVWLVIQNMIQFYTSHKVEKIMGHRNFHKVLSLSGIQLHQGGQGNREIRITDKPSDPKELSHESYMRSLLTKEKVEIVEVTPKSLRDMRFDLKIDFEEEESPETERVLYIDYIKTLLGLFGQSGLISPKKALFRVMEKFGDNPSDLMDETAAMEYERDAFGIDENGQTVQQAKQQQQQLQNQMGQPGQPGQMGQMGQQGQMGQTPAFQDIRQRGIGMRNGAAGPGQQMVNRGVAKRNILT